MSYQSSLQPISCSLSLSSCRLKAEAIARALNNRIWPAALINDCDDHSSGDEALQVTAPLKGSCGTRPGGVIDRPPQAHDIYDSGDKVIGHCWLNGMQTEDDEEYFDTPPCSSPPSPAEEEIIVNPPTHNGIPQFFTEYSYQQHEPHHSGELPSFTGYSDDERIASGTKLFEKLQRYSESLSQNEEGSETFYDVSDYEDYEEQSTAVPNANESDRSVSCSKDLSQSTEANRSGECPSSPNMTVTTEEIENSDPPLLLSDINIAVNSEENAVEDSEHPDVCENSPASEKANDTSDEVRKDLEVANATREVESDATHISDDSGAGQYVSDDHGVSKSSDDSHSSVKRRDQVKPAEVSFSDEICPDIGIVPPSPLPSSSSFSSSNYSDDDIRDLPTDRAAEPSDNHLVADFRLRRIQELEEEERPKLLRSTSLKTGKTPPGTPGQKKIVRFADALGLDLEAVRHIVQDDLPNVPSSAYTDLNLAEIDDGSSGVQQLQSRENDRITFPGSLWNPVAVPGAGSQSLIPQFQPPSTKPDFLDRVRRQYVCLESIIVSDLTLHCTCRVLNVSFEKFVAARYTTNEWQTCEEVVASYVPNSSDGVFDKFSFSLFLRYLLPHQRLLFAIRYIVGGTEYWDNNYGANYALRSHSNAPALPSAEDGSFWMHHFY